MTIDDILTANIHYLELTAITSNGRRTATTFIYDTDTINRICRCLNDY